MFKFGDGKSIFNSLTVLGPLLYEIGQKACELGIIPGTGWFCAALQGGGIVLTVAGIRKMLERYLSK